MLLSHLHIIGFRNFKDCKINFSSCSLIIGPNDVGKTNLIHAIRLLLDRSLSESDIQPTDTDFYAFEPTNKFSITAHFSEIKYPQDECLLSLFNGDVKDGKAVIQYVAERTAAKKIDYKLFVGRDIQNLTEYESRRYLRRLHLEYVSSYRDLKMFIKREQRAILDQSKDERTDKQVKNDNKNLEKLEKDLDKVTKKVSKFHFIKSATTKFNSELKKMSAENDTREISFDAGATDSERFINNLALVSQKHGKSLNLGGDGRNNQIFLSMWSSTRENVETERVLYAIEEPEAHLHPQQQRRLSEYLVNEGKGQLIITSHSPQIASEFLPNSIVRLYTDGYKTLAANDGVSMATEGAALKFAHRMNIIPAESFFADGVILVEGVSEVLFYKAFANSIGKNLDHHNISVLSVEGVGFLPYAELLGELGIPFCFRTDNDCNRVRQKAGKPPKYRNAGLERLISMMNHKVSTKTILDDVTAINEYFEKIYYQPESQQNDNAVKFFSDNSTFFDKHGFFLSQKDLEHDLIASPILNTILKYTECAKEDDALTEMKAAKGQWMFGFLKKHEAELKKLENTKFQAPINFFI